LAVACASNSEWANRHLQHHLKDLALHFKSVKINDEIGMPEVLATGPLGAGACATISFPRNAFEERFLRDLISAGSASQAAAFIPFTSPGIETVVRGDEVLVKVHAGTIVHMRDDLVYNNDSRAFKQGAKGRVVWVEGDVVRAQAKGQPSLRKFVILPVSESIPVSERKMSRQPDGSYTGQLRIDQDQVRFAPRFTPRLSNAGQNEYRCVSERNPAKK
jgi:hypothetical protein